MNRADILGETAGLLDGLHLGRPVRVAVDGRTASGKTTMADELADLLRELGRPVIRTSVDGFHRPRAERYARGRHSAEGYYHDSRDLPAVVTMLLAPLGPGGDRLYRTASFDLEADRPVEQAPHLADANAILVVDGTFLQRPELREHWDATLFVRTSADVSERRGVERDTEFLGGEEAARLVYGRRYRPAYDLYERLCEPERHADLVVDNDELHHPRLHRRALGRFP